MLAKLLELKEEMRRRMHRPIPEQGEWLKQVVEGSSTTTPCRPTAGRSRPSDDHHGLMADARFGGGARRTDHVGADRPTGRRCSPSPVSYTLGRTFASPSDTQGGSRMRASRMYRSVRGDRGNPVPYRDGQAALRNGRRAQRSATA